MIRRRRLLAVATLLAALVAAAGPIAVAAEAWRRRTPRRRAAAASAAIRPGMTLEETLAAATPYRWSGWVAERRDARLCAIRMRTSGTWAVDDDDCRGITDAPDEASAVEDMLEMAPSREVGRFFFEFSDGGESATEVWVVLVIMDADGRVADVREPIR